MADQTQAQQWTRDRLIEAIRTRAAEHGLPPEFAVRVAELESTLRPGVRNRPVNPKKGQGTSASGLFQLTDKRRIELGLDPIAARNLPVEEEIDAGLRSLRKNQEYLLRRLKREPELHEVYAAQFGPLLAYKVITADPATRSEKLMSRETLKANPQFRNKSAAELLEGWRAKLGDVPAAAPVRPGVPAVQRLTPQQIEQQVVPQESPLDWEEVMRGQLSAQAPSEEPVMMADGGDVGEHLTRLIENAKTDDHFRQIGSLIAAHYPRHRASGSPPEGETSNEPTAEELEAASKPSFRTAAAGGGRKRGNITEALQSGTAARELLKGATMLPQNLVGAPVDIATMVMRPFGYNVEKPVMGSEWLKEKTRQAGLAYAPSGNEAERGFFTAGDILGGLVNPAAPVRGAVAAAGKTGEAARMLAKDFQAYNRALGPADASYAVRPTGSVMATEMIGGRRSGVEKILEEGKKEARSSVQRAFPEQQFNPETSRYVWPHEEGLHPPLTPSDVEAKEELIYKFWDTKAKNYFTKQFGTPKDPIAEAIAKKRIRSSILEAQFPDYMLDPLYMGTTRANPQGGAPQFFPKYPRAWEDFTQRYDKSTGIAGDVVLPGQGTMGTLEYTYQMGPAGEKAFEAAKQAEADRLLAQGVPPSQINIQLGEVFRSGKDPEKVVTGRGTNRAEELFKAYETRLAGGPEPKYVEMGYEFPPLSETVGKAVEKGQPVYDIKHMYSPLTELFDPGRINYYLASIPTREAANMRFEDVVRGAIEMGEAKMGLKALDTRIREGKQVPQKVFDEGLSQPLWAFPPGSPFEGYTWRRIEDRKATVPEGAYIGHSVGGYELGGFTYGASKRNGFNTGEYQIYTLRDPRNRPVTTIEARRMPSGDLDILQIKGDGRATGNTAPVQHEQAVLSFLQNQLKPVAIMEKNDYLTPALQLYKERLNNPGAVEPPALPPQGP